MSSRVFKSWATWVALIAVLSLLLAACGDDDDDDNGDANGQAGSWDETITFADGGFDSILFHNRVAQYILEHGYGYETEGVPAETVTAVTGLRNNDIQVYMEVWADQIPAWFDGLDEGSVVDLGSNYGQSIQGWFVPTYMIEGDEERGIEPMTPDLESVDDLPQYWELFADPENPDKGRFYNCISGWECAEVNMAKLEAYELEEYYDQFNPGSGPALATSLVSAYEQGEPWFGYYWAPTWIFAQLDLTMIEEPEYTDECWETILEGEEACAYPSVDVRVGANTEFIEQAPDVEEFLSNYDSTMDGTSEVLLYIRDNDADALEAAIWWLENNPDIWAEWVSEDVAEDVEAALDAGETLED